MKRNDGKNFELQTKLFFSKLFEKIGYVVHKERMQFSGTQDGFDVQFVISDNFIERKIFIECKDYSTDLKFGNIYSKAHDLEANYDFNKDDIVFFISPKSRFSNGRNSEKSEPIFNNGKFPFETRLLDLGNNIKQLFSIDKGIYKEIYGEFPFEEIDKEKEIKRFKSILKSRGVLKKILLKERDRYNYITDIKPLRNLIQRTVSESKTTEDENTYLYLKSKNKKTLLSLIPKLFDPINVSNDGIVLLGNPGLGKSIELKQSALSLWEIKNEIKIIPYFRLIDTFSTTSEIEDYLPKDWKHLQQLVIILDGLDEISKSKDFISKLEKFIVDHKNEATNIKFVLSCRANIYYTNIKSISNFQSYFLDDIRFSDAYRFLEDTYNLSYEMLSKLPNSQVQFEFLSNPYYLNLFGNYYDTHKIIPSNKAILMNEYVKMRLEDDRRIKYKNKPYDPTLTESICKKVAIVMEARQINKIEERHLNALLKSEKNLFIDACFVEKVSNDDFWKFEHRNLQEFFVAKSLSKLPLKDIIDFIAIDNSIQKVHPSWLNSVSYLLNLMDENNESYNQLIVWLKENDTNVLFHADSNRISKKIQMTVFQEFFTKRCKEQNLWISKYDAQTSDLARFGDCQKNVDFLLQEINDTENHRRTRISAIDIVAKMNFLHKRNELKFTLLNLLSAPLEKVDFNFKADVLNAIKETQIFKDEEYIKEIIKSLGKYDNHRMISGVLRLIKEGNPEIYLGYIQNVTPKILVDSKKNYPRLDNWMSSEKDVLKEVLNKLNTVDFISFKLKTILYNEHPLEFENKDLESVIDELTQLYPKNEKYIYGLGVSLLISDLKKSNNFYDFPEMMRDFFIKTNTIEKAFSDIYKQEIEFSRKRSTLASLYTFENFETILNDFESEIITKKELKFFRNNLSHVDFDLGKEFETQIINKANYEFDEEFLSQDKRDEWSEFHRTNAQVNFDLLFQEGTITEKIDDYFASQKETIVTYETIRDNKTEYWNNLELRKRFPQVLLSFIYSALHKNEHKVTKEDVMEILSKELYLIEKIKDKLNDDNQIEVKDSQLEFIKNWCISNLSIANFNDINQTDSNRTICELLWYFRNTFNFTYPEYILLDMLVIDGKMKTNDSNYYGHDYIFNSINNQKLQERIAYNLTNKLVKDSTFKSHADYILKHNLNTSYNTIREHLKDASQIRYYRSQILPEYIDKTDDIKLLKELLLPKPLDQHSDDLTWEAVAILIALKENTFVIEKLLDFLEIDDNHENQLRTIKYLIKANYEESFNVFNTWLKNSISYYKEEVNFRISSDDWKQHTNEASISYLIELIKIGADEKYNFGRSTNPMQVASDVLLVIAEKNGTNTCLEIIEKVTLCIEELKGVTYETFYINTLINDLNNVYYKLKSNPLSFGEIESKLEKHKYNI